MYPIVSCFDVPADRRQDFIAAALADGLGSIASEPGTVRFEVIQDERSKPDSA